MKPGQRDLPALPGEPLHVYGFSAKGLHGEHVQLQKHHDRSLVFFNEPQLK